MSKKASEAVVKKAYVDITGLDVSPPDLETLASDAARRIIQKLTWYLNICREKGREICFLKDRFPANRQCVCPLQYCTLGVGELQGSGYRRCEDLYGAALPADISTDYRKSWESSIETTAPDFDLRVVYDVTIYQEEHRDEMEKLSRSIHVLNVALPVYLRFTGNGRAAEFSALHKDSFRVVILIGKMLL